MVAAEFGLKLMRPAWAGSRGAYLIASVTAPLRARHAGCRTVYTKEVGRKMNWTPEQEFVFRAAPLEWLEYAEELWENASRLFEAEPNEMTVTVDPVRGQVMRPAFSRPYLLLAAFAIENAMKGVAVARHPDLIRGGRIAKALETHRITRIANELAQIELTPEESAVCEFLETAIPSWGRYPVPRKISGVAKEVMSSPDLNTVIAALFARVVNILNDLTKNGWRGPHDMTMAPPESIPVPRS
jgi:hypothetical protein